MGLTDTLQYAAAPRKRTSKSRNTTHLMGEKDNNEKHERKIESDKIQHLTRQWKPIFMQASEAIQKEHMPEV